jgi:outer membrane cobalamin receptor
MLIFSRGFYLLAFIFFMSFKIYAQDFPYQGEVLDNNHVPIQGVNISAGGGTGTSTSLNGAFSLNIKLPARIRFSYLGFKTREIVIINITTRPDTIYLEEESLGIGQVVVTAGKRGQNINEVSQSMEVLHPDFLIQTQTTQVQKALEKVPGIVVQKDQVSIRGASGFSYGAGSRVLILLDDMPMLSADASDPKWNYYPIENISQIEVLKGAASALYGSAAMEGIIHLRTAVAADTSYTQVKVYGGFYDHPVKKDTGFWAKQKTPRMLEGISIAHRQSFGPLKVTASATFNNDDGFRLGEKTYISRGNLFMQYTPPKNNRLVFTFSINGMEDNGQIFLFYPDVKNAYIPAQGTSSDYNFFRWHADFSMKYYASETSKHIYRTRYFTTINMNTSNNNQSSTGRLWFNEYQFQKQLFKRGNSETNLTAGVDYSLTQTLSDSLYGHHMGNNVAAYAQIDRIIGKFIFNVGGRMETNKVDTFKWDYAPVLRAGFNFQATPYTFIRASFGQGFRYPSVAEKFATAAAGAIHILPNPELHSEKGWSSELAVRQLFNIGSLKGYIDASAFYSEYQDMIEYIFGYYPPPGAVFNFKYVGFKAKNIENTKIEGFEISTGMEKDFNNVHVDISGGYTFVLPYNADSVGKKLSDSYHQYLSFRHRDIAKANLNIGYKKLSFGFYGFYNSPYLNMDQFFIDLIGGLKKDNYWMPYSSAFVADMRLSYKIKKNVNLSFFAKNVFNKEYMEVPGNTNAPRNFQLQMVWEF